jgi:hypothetical protein
MTAAAITSVVKKELSGNIGCEIVKGAVAASGDFYDSRFGTIVNVQATPSVAQVCGVTVSGSRVTILTAAADINLVIWGY